MLFKIRQINAVGLLKSLPVLLTYRISRLVGIVGLLDSKKSKLLSLDRT